MKIRIENFSGIGQDTKVYHVSEEGKETDITPMLSIEDMTLRIPADDHIFATMIIKSRKGLNLIAQLEKISITELEERYFDEKAEPKNA